MFLGVLFFFGLSLTPGASALKSPALEHFAAGLATEKKERERERASKLDAANAGQAQGSNSLLVPRNSPGT